MEVPSVYVSLDETIKQLRAELKREFPATKFSVKRGRGTAYSWLHVSWTDGPTDSEVSAITRFYQGQGFDGMTDSTYSIDHLAADENGNPVRVHHGTAGINTSRTISPALANKCIKMIAEYWGGVSELPTAVEGYFGYELEPKGINREPVRADLPRYDYDWSTQIHRCAARPADYVRRVEA